MCCPSKCLPSPVLHRLWTLCQNEASIILGFWITDEEDPTVKEVWICTICKEYTSLCANILILGVVVLFRFVIFSVTLPVLIDTTAVTTKHLPVLPSFSPAQYPFHHDTVGRCHQLVTLSLLADILQIQYKHPISHSVARVYMKEENHFISPDHCPCPRYFWDFYLYLQGIQFQNKRRRGENT